MRRIFIKIFASILILVGVAGLVLPFVPGVLLIAAGAAMFLNETVKKE